MPSKKNSYPTHYLRAGWRLVLPSKFAPLSRGVKALYSTQQSTRKHIVPAQLVSLLLGKDPQGSCLAGNQALGLTSVKTSLDTKKKIPQYKQKCPRCPSLTAHSNEQPKPWYSRAAVNHLPMRYCKKPAFGPALSHRSGQLAHTWAVLDTKCHLWLFLTSDCYQIQTVTSQANLQHTKARDY